METLLKKIITICIIIIIIMFLLSVISFWKDSTQIKIHEQSIDENQSTLSQDYFLNPDEIIIYQNGNSRTINKNDNLFNDIVNEMNKREDSDIDIAKLAFDKKSMETIKQKEVIVEYVYYTSHQLEINGMDKQYNGLIFPLTGDNKELCFFENNSDNYNGPIGFLKDSDALLDLILGGTSD